MLNTIKKKKWVSMASLIFKTKKKYLTCYDDVICMNLFNETHKKTTYH